MRDREHDLILKRLRHLLKSEVVRKFDEVDCVTNGYKRDIEDLDKMFDAAYEKMGATIFSQHKGKNIKPNILNNKKLILSYEMNSKFDAPTVVISINNGSTLEVIHKIQCGEGIIDLTSLLENKYIKCEVLS